MSRRHWVVAAIVVLLAVVIGTSRTISALILVVWLLFAAIPLYVLSKAWGSVSIATKLLTILLSLTFLAITNDYVASSLPYELRGGGPENGKVVDGHYFVGNHGKYTEVSKRFFENSLRYQQISHWIAFGLVVVLVIGIAARVYAVKRVKRLAEEPLPSGQP